MMHVYIYHLTDEAGRVRYVGVSANPQIRVASHMQLAFHNHTRVCEWLRELWFAGKMPGLTVGRECGPDCYADERAEIVRLAAAGEPLLNGTCLPREKMSRRQLREVVAARRDKLSADVRRQCEMSP